MGSEEKKPQESVEPTADETTEDKVFTAMYEAYNLMRQSKPNDRSEMDRRYAVAITEMEKTIAYFYTWCVMTPTEIE
jgi:hypothetical protein